MEVSSSPLERVLVLKVELEVSREETRPVEKKVGRVCWRM